MSEKFTRADLPQFKVSAVEQGVSADDGFTEWRLKGSLDRLQGISFDSWCYLLGSGRESFTGNFSLPVGETRETVFTTHRREKPAVEGLTLSCMGAYHQAYHVWMVEEGPKAWTETVFAASDAVAEHFVGTDGKTWRKLSKLTTGELKQNGEESWIVPGGWDHEHCAICSVHIDPGDRHFHHAELNEFLCVSCYERYVLAGDIGFTMPGE